MKKIILPPHIHEPVVRGSRNQLHVANTRFYHNSHLIEIPTLLNTTDEISIRQARQDVKNKFIKDYKKNIHLLGCKVAGTTVGAVCGTDNATWNLGLPSGSSTYWTAEIQYRADGNIYYNDVDVSHSGGNHPSGTTISQNSAGSNQAYFGTPWHDDANALPASPPYTPAEIVGTTTMTGKSAAGFFTFTFGAETENSDTFPGGATTSTSVNTPAWPNSGGTVAVYSASADFTATTNVEYEYDVSRNIDIEYTGGGPGAGCSPVDETWALNIVILYVHTP